MHKNNIYDIIRNDTGKRIHKKFNSPTFFIIQYCSYTIIYFLYEYGKAPNQVTNNKFLSRAFARMCDVENIEKKNAISYVTCVVIFARAVSP